MFLKEYINHPEIQPFLKEVQAGEHLFRQGEMGRSMFVILDGIVQLFDDGGDEQHLIGTFGPGQFFGEKALVKPQRHQRFYSALAQIRTTTLEVSLADLPTIESVIPDFMLKMFQSAAQRLDRAYYLIRVLRSTDDMERLIHSILYLYRSPGLEGASTHLVPLTVDDIHYLINMDKTKLVKCLEALVSQNILVKRPNDCYLLRDEHALVRAISLAQPKAA
jgi:CRP-like cAMP-binding protein